MYLFNLIFVSRHKSVERKLKASRLVLTDLPTDHYLLFGAMNGHAKANQYRNIVCPTHIFNNLSH